ncbi:hypothetical protein Tco_0598406 [Tanacetum coccineum]
MCDFKVNAASINLLLAEKVNAAKLGITYYLLGLITALEFDLEKRGIANMALLIERVDSGEEGVVLSHGGLGFCRVKGRLSVLGKRGGYPEMDYISNPSGELLFLDKPTKSEGFEQIVDFLNASSIRYALIVNPTIYTSCIQQFWATVKVKTINEEVQLQALVDGKTIIITKSTIRRDLQLEDVEGIDCLPNAAIFEELTLIGYEKLS